MSIDETVQTIQFAYPRVYLACHTRHQRKRTSAARLSARDSAILSHLSMTTPMTQAALGAHLSVARSTVSEALKRLTRLGFTQQAVAEAGNNRRRGVKILLTQKGLEAIQATSVLETARLRQLVEELTPAEQRVVTRGMMLLAAACGRMADRTTGRR